ncbi:2,3-diaminopropionate biosynthesis protein SbnA [Maribacter hydrothermalis]|uniref:N-(2-amino-2-carboxyethyl)-L-glutamate synthase n=1 Tax=Maribacter hydrothermalis TaxID=1836467 RepID=A0A1B7Z068_9FLAO|nr:2,3-diaminopropionate biosynthesis protein SbnA [Maribacter hydrothermalis]APQ16238.1 2,3-diaminopropionate biosynthesis protein SbnA [Maribacter hydrothermalis]OBR36074.1 2,3-diaminopropionate biosynthesis protein SbnA [Maribacter hydrothermalis]
MITQNIAHTISESIVDTVGNTPLVKLNKINRHANFNLYGKLEAANPAGSIKDRTSLFILQKALADGRIKNGDTVIESSSGNMAVGLAQACLYFDLNLIVVVDPKLNSHTEKILRTYGVRIEKVTKPKQDGGYLGARLEKVQHLLATIPNSFWSNQYGNQNNPLTHHQTMTEIMDALHGKLDYLFVATSTCGTLMGCADFIVKNNLDTKIIAVDAVGSVLFGGPPLKRLIPGHGAGVPSQFLDTNRIYDQVYVDDVDCARGCWSLLEKEAILCGGSSGGMISAVEKYSKNIKADSNCALFLCDRGERYLDTIYNTEWLLKELPESRNAFTPLGGWQVA